MKPSVDILIQQAQLAEREGRRDDARSLYERALYSLKRAADGKLASSLLRWIGRTYQFDADPEAALDCLEAAIAVAELVGDTGAVGHAVNIRPSFTSSRVTSIPRKRSTSTLARMPSTAARRDSLP
jgi:tetratricopeptide (TPR) repeat protein